MLGRIVTGYLALGISIRCRWDAWRRTGTGVCTPEPPPPDPWAWYYRLYFTVAFVILVGEAAAVSLGPGRWTSAPSLQPLHDLVPYDFRLFGVVFLLLAVGLCWWKTRPAAYLMSAVVFAVFFLQQFQIYIIGTPPRPSGHPPNPINVVSIGMGALAVLAMLPGYRYAVLNYQRHEKARR